MPANTNLDWLVELVFEVYGEQGSPSDASKGEGTTNSAGVSFTSMQGGGGGAGVAAGATAAWEDADTTCVVTPGCVGLAAGRVSPQLAGGQKKLLVAFRAKIKAQRCLVAVMH
jgi:hypothetical protein